MNRGSSRLTTERSRVNRRERSFCRQLELTHGPIDATAHIQKRARLTISSQPRDALSTRLYASVDADFARSQPSKLRA